VSSFVSSGRGRSARAPSGRNGCNFVDSDLRNLEQPVARGVAKQSGTGRETHKVMLDHYQQTKNLLVSYSPKALGFF